MKPVEVSKQIQAGVDEVFAVFSDLEHCAERIDGIAKLEILSDGPVGLGTRWRETRVMFGKEATEVMEITQWQPPHSYLTEAKSHGSHYLSEFRFEPQDGGTLVTMTFQARPLTLFARIMGFLMGPVMRGSIVKCFNQDMDDLKRFLESANASN